jgi:threonine/homoserine/homoserine lactone efflux protein
MNANNVFKWGAVAFLAWMAYKAFRVIEGINSRPFPVRGALAPSAPRE